MIIKTGIRENAQQEEEALRRAALSQSLTPKQIVAELDKYIIGQQEAKRSVAIALRNRWRRQQLDPELREEIAPKNIIMIGPTGVGKRKLPGVWQNSLNRLFSKLKLQNSLKLAMSDAMWNL